MILLPPLPGLTLPSLMVRRPADSFRGLLGGNRPPEATSRGTTCKGTWATAMVRPARKRHDYHHTITTILLFISQTTNSQTSLIRPFSFQGTPPHSPSPPSSSRSPRSDYADLHVLDCGNSTLYGSLAFHFDCRWGLLLRFVATALWVHKAVRNIPPILLSQCVCRLIG